MVQPYAEFNKMAADEITPASDNPFERIEEVVGTARKDNKWQSLGTKIS